MEHLENQILWTPSNEQKQTTSLWKFAQNTAYLHGCAPKDYAGLLNWSIEQPVAYYDTLWDELDIIGHKGGQSFVPGATMLEAKFFPNAKLNYAENLLREPDEQIAIISLLDDGTRREISRQELYDWVSQIIQALKTSGIVKGDRISAIVTNEMEAVAIYLACAAMGAIWASCSPDFGPAGASDRLAQIEPKILVAVPGYKYGQKNIDIADSIRSVAKTSSIEKIVILGSIPNGVNYGKPTIALKEWLAPHKPNTISFLQASFDTPLAILFSSGTTGAPKCIVHRAGGLLLQHKKELSLHANIKRGDRLFYFTTCGWMMWNWQLSALSIGATIITYDGNPFYPEPTRLADILVAEQVNIFGTSAKYIDACASANVKPLISHDLKNLHTILSTGSALLPQSFDYIYRDWKADLHLASISGGTDICACFVGGVPILPVRRGELQGAVLGMDLDALDDQGNSLSGAPGEFVCRSPHPSMPLKFWGDDDGTIYQNAYFSRFENIWAQGDFVEKRSGGGYIIHGRSDTTLNPGGVRIGTAEIYRQVEKIDDILEAVAVGKDIIGDQEVVLFVRLATGADLSADLIATIRHNIRTGATPRHVPARIVAVPDIPRTRSGKISEIAVRDTIHDRPIKNTTALANSECLGFYKEWARNISD